VDDISERTHRPESRVSTVVSREIGYYLGIMEVDADDVVAVIA
jgi:hypothetical protein